MLIVVPRVAGDFLSNRFCGDQTRAANHENENACPVPDNHASHHLSFQACMARGSLSNGNLIVLPAQAYLTNHLRAAQKRGGNDGRQAPKWSLPRSSITRRLRAFRGPSLLCAFAPRREACSPFPKQKNTFRDSCPNLLA